MQRRLPAVLSTLWPPSPALTWHVDHAAVTVLHDVAGLTVDPTGGDAVNGKEVEPHLGGPALAPRRGQVCELQGRKEGQQSALELQPEHTQGLLRSLMQLKNN